MDRPLLPLLLLLLLCASVFSDRCEEISSSVVFNQIAISSLLQNQNACSLEVKDNGQALIDKVEAIDQEVKDNGQALIDKVEAIDQGIQEILASMQKNLTEELKTWVETTLDKYTEESKKWLSERVLNISERFTVGQLQYQQIMNATHRILQQQMAGQVSTEEESQAGKVKDCLSYKLLGRTVTGIYNIYPYNCSTKVTVWCDMENDGGGWSTIVKRMEQTPQIEFRRGWEEYKKGFGDPQTEYWLGNEVIYALTTGMENEIRVDGEAFSSTGGRRYGYWDDFYIENETNKYKLHIGEIKSDKSTMGDTLYRSNNNKFTTIDSDNDSRGSENCASDYGGGGWWYDSCSNAFPTGPITHTDKWDDSLNMYKWVPNKYSYYSLRSVEIKFRSSLNEIRYC